MVDLTSPEARERIAESDLRHGADHDRFAAAMQLCTWGAPDCSYSGFCMKDGECFTPPRRDRFRELERRVRYLENKIDALSEVAAMLKEE